MITCPYCSIRAVRALGDKIYPHRPDLAQKRFYLCPQCGSYVGCHPGTWKEMGRLANEELRKAKSLAHTHFDLLWIGAGNMSRREAYAWLANAMGIKAEDCHIGRFDVDQCHEAIGHVNALDGVKA